MFRVGVGYDSHRTIDGRPLILGGERIPSSVGLKGHSDGDALLHALTDALLGAAGEGSIGERFPDTDARWKSADSAIFVEGARKLVETRGWRVANADAVVIAEAPKIAPHAAAIRSRLAELLGVGPEAVGVRGTSTNGMGFPGRNEGVAAMVVVLLERIES